MTGLCTLAEFDLNHFHLIARGFRLEKVWIEPPIGCAATKVPGRDLPNEITTATFMIDRQ